MKRARNYMHAQYNTVPNHILAAFIWVVEAIRSVMSHPSVPFKHTVTSVGAASKRCNTSPASRRYSHLPAGCSSKAARSCSAVVQTSTTAHTKASTVAQGTMLSERQACGTCAEYDVWYTPGYFTAGELAARALVCEPDGNHDIVNPN